MLTPVEPVPRHQMWAWTAESRKAIADAQAVTCLLSGPAIILISLHVQHDTTHRRG